MPHFLLFRLHSSCIVNVLHPQTTSHKHTIKTAENTLILGVDKPTMCVTKCNETKQQKQKKPKALSDVFGTFIALENESQA